MRSRSSGLSAAAVLLALVSTGCGGSVPAADTAAESSAHSPAESPAESPAGSPAGSSAGAAPSVGEGTATPSTTTSPAAGRLVGDGYSFVLPDRWQDATEQFKEYSELIDAGALNADQTDQPFSDLVNVIRNADQVELPPAQAEHQFTEELRTVATRVEVRPGASIDGVDALHLTGRTQAGTVTTRTDQYIAHVGGAYYVVTFSYGTGTPRAQRDREVASMLSSWAWATSSR